ncbi:DUF92 domain-containing protein [Armatimonas rosea]|uniref:Uncharacterized protein (TIGR00297 family) n=1 Tax=Armatimonas rosea TaxID=685828 RepID=A0A7W9ST30_ARMRO|nr:DUF92 domain-containing protein [Armatimonas rosea]MBB6051773.1 uncharacterized protein (TIGR00297 family) [Armatimonas rosea]
MTPLLAATIGAPLMGFLAWRVRALTLSGAVAAAGVGFCHLAFGGWLAAGALLTFFGTSTALSKLGKRKKDKLGFEKPGQRDAWQVLANGGIAALCALLGQPEAMLGALAAANADTWATELGSLFGGKPRRITTLAPAEPGESGAVSVLGTLAALAGAALIGGLPCLWGRGGLFLTVTLAGFLGALVDSVLGATLQAQWWDEQKKRWSEIPQGKPTRGVNWMRNDAVNILATLVGAVTAYVLGHVLIH